MKKLVQVFLLVTSLSVISCSSSSDDATTSQAHYKIILTGTAYNDQCQTTGEPPLNNQYSIKAEYLSDSNVAGSNSWVGVGDTPISDSKELNGNTIGVRVKLNNYNSSNPDIGKGTGITVTNIKIVDLNTSAILLNDDNPFYLIICTDVVYDATLTYNTLTGDHEITSLTN